MYRVVHYADGAARVPPKWLGYRHAGKEVWYTEDMKSYKICEAESEKCSSSLTKHSVFDHFMSTYLKMSGGGIDYMSRKIMRRTQ